MRGGPRKTQEVVSMPERLVERLPGHTEVHSVDLNVLPMTCVAPGDPVIDLVKDLDLNGSK